MSEHYTEKKRKRGRTYLSRGSQAAEICDGADPTPVAADQTWEYMCAAVLRLCVGALTEWESDAFRFWGLLIISLRILRKNVLLIKSAMVHQKRGKDAYLDKNKSTITTKMRKDTNYLNIFIGRLLFSTKILLFTPSTFKILKKKQKIY